MAVGQVRAGADLVVRVLCRAEPFGAALYHHLRLGRSGLGRLG